MKLRYAAALRRGDVSLHGSVFEQNFRSRGLMLKVLTGCTVTLWSTHLHNATTPGTRNWLKRQEWLSMALNGLCDARIEYELRAQAEKLMVALASNTRARNFH